MQSSASAGENGAPHRPTRRVTIQREFFRNRDSYVARNEDGEWVTFGDAKSAPKGPHAIVEYLFGVGEVVNVETDPEQATIVADIVAY